jgi:hypothetical protein
MWSAVAPSGKSGRVDFQYDGGAGVTLEVQCDAVATVEPYPWLGSMLIIALEFSANGTATFFGSSANQLMIANWRG